MHRRIARSFFILICGALAAAVGVGAALLYTSPGRDLLVRLVSDQSHRFLRGSLRIGGVTGSWIGGLTLDDVAIRDTAGALFLSAPQVVVRYRVRNLLAGRFVIEEARLVRPELQFLQHRSRPDAKGRLNLEEIFRLGEGTGGGASPLVEIRNLTIEDGQLVIRLPWNPDGRLRTRTQVDSALAAQREQPGRRIEEGPEGLELIRTVRNLSGFATVLRLASPDGQPITVRFERLAARVSDPALEIRDLRGTFRTRNDSLLFDAERLELPGSSMTGSGRLDWPRDTLLYQVRFDAPRLALADLRWVSPEFPAFTGSARIRGASRSGSRIEFEIRDLAVGDATSRVTGRMVAINDIHRGLGFRGLDLGLSRLDLEAVRPYLDTLPFAGRISGPLEADGFFDGMTVALDWEFEDARIEGGATSRISLTGPVRMSQTEGLIFEGATLRSSDVDLRTVRLISPSLRLDGRIAAEGSLTGLLQNVVFQGTAAHRDGDRPVSRLNGRVRLDTRGEILDLETDVVLDSLVFAGLRGSFPSLPARGSLGGRVRLAGTLLDLDLDATVGGSLGRIRARGGATLFPPQWGARTLEVAFDRLDLSAIVAGAPATRLEGRLEATGRLDSATAPAGSLRLELGRGSVSGFELDSTRLGIRALDSLVAVDTVVAHWAGGRLEGSGTIGWAGSRSGTLAFHAEATELTPFDSLARALTGLTRDSAAGDVAMRGRGRADVALSGSLPALQVEANVAIDSVHWLRFRGRGLGGRLAWTPPSPDGGRDSSLVATAFADSFSVRRLLFTEVTGAARGTTDSLRWRVGLRARNQARASASGRYLGLPAAVLFEADSLNLDLLGRRWSLQVPLQAVVNDQGISLDTVRLTTADGSGAVELAGTVPGEEPGDLQLRLLGVELRDLYGLAQRDTTGIAGSVAVDARLGGTARAPETRGSATLTGGRFGDFQAPLIRGVFDYRDRRLQANLTFWRAGRPVVEAEAALPLDLALTGVPSRQLPGPIAIRARGDSVDLAVVEAFTPNVRQVTGRLDVDARIEGTWEAPRLAGWVRFRDGAATVPGLGVRYQNISGAVRLAGDSILGDGLRIGGRFGVLEIGGGLRLERLTRPLLDLRLTASDFEVMDVPSFMAIRSSGEVRLTGTPARPLLTGRGRIANSVVQFADLVQKEIVNLEDPLFSDLVDTLAMRRHALRAAFQSRFLDSLLIRGLTLEIGEGVWLRSNEANFQLQGSVLVDKSRYQTGQSMYTIAGDLNVPRGTYILKAGGFINRTFTVGRGTVRYFGDPNAELDVEAQHMVRSPQLGNESIPVIAHITGTLLVPQLTLRTTAYRAPLSEAQLISLLTVGSTDFAMGTVQQQVAVAAASALAGELQRALISDLRAPVDIIEIRPGVAAGGRLGQGAVSTQLAVGRSLSEKLFISANAGFCLMSGQPAFNARNLGATLEYRFRPGLRGQLSAEPVLACLPGGVDIFGTARRYQFGAELRWDRDY